MDAKAFLKYLLKHHYLTKTQLQESIQESQTQKQKLDCVLIQKGYLTRAQFIEAQKGFVNLHRDITQNEIEPSLSQEKTISLSSQELTTASKQTQQKKIGKYEILEKLGQGGMGVVYKVRHTTLEQIYALKSIIFSASTSAEDIQRFHREAKFLAQLKHPGIVQIIDFGCENEQYYFVMEYVEGISLDQWILKKLPLQQGLHILQKCLLALHYAHRQGIIHRDLKPGNIFITTEDDPKIGDFGLAKDVRQEQHTQQITQTGQILGTPAYMAPEQISGKTDEIDAQSDIYSIGVCLYKMITGHTPFEGNTIVELFYKTIHDEVRPPSQWNPEISKDLEIVVLKALAKEKAQRYRTAKLFAEDIECVLTGHPIKAKALGSREKWVRKVKKHRQSIGVGFVVFFLCVIGATLYHHLFASPPVLPKPQHTTTSVNGTHSVQNTRPDAESCYQMGDLKESQNDFQEALRLYAQAVEIDPKMAKAHAKLGRLFYELKNYPEALSSCEKAIQLDPKIMIAYYVRALTKSRQKDFVAAITDFTKALELEPNNIPSLLNRALAKEDQGDIRGAIVDLGEVIRLDPRNFAAYNNRASLKIKLGDMDGAIADMTACLSLNPGQNALTYYNLGILKQSKNDFTGAIDDFSRTITLNPKDFLPYLRRGILYKLNKEFKIAIDDFSQALRLNPKCGEAYYYRAEILQMLGDYKASLADWNEALIYIQDPSLIFEIYYWRTTAKEMLNDLEGALQDINKCVAMDAQNPPSLFKRGNLLFKKKQYSEALVTLNQVLQVDANFREVYYVRGWLYCETGQLEFAEKEFRTYLEKTQYLLDAATLQNHRHIFKKFPQLKK